MLFIDGCVYYTDGEPASIIMEQFQQRSDNQITTLEILAIAVGLSSFAHMLRGRRCVIFSDNRGAEGSVIKGASRAWDQCLLIHEVWTLVSVCHRIMCCAAHVLLQAWLLKLHFWVLRVPSEDNIADLPSREYYQLMDDIGAEWLAPTVAGLFLPNQ